MSECPTCNQSRARRKIAPQAVYFDVLSNQGVKTFDTAVEAVAWREANDPAARILQKVIASE